MVKVEEIKDNDASRPYSNSEASASSDSLSSVSTTSSFDDGTPESESFFQRISALVDIVPPKTRSNITQTVNTTTSYIKKSTSVVGNIVWILTTSALLVGLPLALSVEGEAEIVAREREIEGQTEGQQMLANPSMYHAVNVPAPQGGLVPPGF